MLFPERSQEQFPEHNVAEGLGIISRFPIVHRHKVKLHRDANDGLDFHQRLLLGVTVEIDSDDEGNHRMLDVYTTHLTPAIGRNV